MGLMLELFVNHVGPVKVDLSLAGRGAKVRHIDLASKRVLTNPWRFNPTHSTKGNATSLCSIKRPYTGDRDVTELVFMSHWFSGQLISF